MAPAIDLDRFMELVNVSGVNLVKIDVEQAELSVLRGMSRIVAADRPHIICELFPQSWIQRDVGSELEAILSQHDYFFYVLTDHGPLNRPHIVGTPDHPNHLFSTLDPGALAAVIADPLPPK